jgi:hypothetical protein
MGTQAITNEALACLAPTARHSILSLGLAPQDSENKKKSALKGPLIDTRFQRSFLLVYLRSWGVAPGLCEKAPMALKT